MQVLPADLPNRLSSSSHSQQDLASRISQAHHLSVAIQRGSELLLAEYVHRQGMPFANDGFNPHIPPIPGLPTPSLSPEAWQDLSDVERLQQNVTAFSSLPEFLSATRRQQEALNSLAAKLHRQLEAAGLQCRGQASNLKSIMRAMDVVPQPTVPVEPPNLVEGFSRKFFGYSVCRLYQDWANRSERDLALLAAKHPL